MKNKRIFSILLMAIILTCTFVMPTNATEGTNNENIEIYIEKENISEETKAKIIAYYTKGETHDDSSDTYGLTCTLLGHKVESSTVRTITHKVRTSSPRCLEKTYDYEACTRCDYESSTLILSEYIVCC